MNQQYRLKALDLAEQAELDALAIDDDPHTFALLALVYAVLAAGDTDG